MVEILESLSNGTGGALAFTEQLARLNNTRTCPFDGQVGVIPDASFKCSGGRLVGLELVGLEFSIFFFFLFVSLCFDFNCAFFFRVHIEMVVLQVSAFQQLLCQILLWKNWMVFYQ